MALAWSLVAVDAGGTRFMLDIGSDQIQRLGGDVPRTGTAGVGTQNEEPQNEEPRKPVVEENQEKVLPSTQPAVVHQDDRTCSKPAVTAPPPYPRDEKVAAAPEARGYDWREDSARLKEWAAEACGSCNAGLLKYCLESENIWIIKDNGIVDSTVGCIQCVTAYAPGCQGAYMLDFCNGTAADRQAIGECRDSPNWSKVEGAGHGRNMTCARYREGSLSASALSRLCFEQNGPMVALAVGETVILLTSSLHPY